MCECLLWSHESAVSCHGGLALAAADLEGMACEPHHRATEQTTHKLENSYIKEVLALLEKF